MFGVIWEMFHTCRVRIHVCAYVCVCVCECFPSCVCVCVGVFVRLCACVRVFLCVHESIPLYIIQLFSVSTCLFVYNSLKLSPHVSVYLAIHVYSKCYGLWY